jgi:carboxylesterase 1
MTIGGVLLPKIPQEILAQKIFDAVPYIVEINKEDFVWLLPMVKMY